MTEMGANQLSNIQRLLVRYVIVAHALNRLENVFRCVQPARMALAGG